MQGVGLGLRLATSSRHGEGSPCPMWSAPGPWLAWAAAPPGPASPPDSLLTHKSAKHPLLQNLPCLPSAHAPADPTTHMGPLGRGPCLWELLGDGDMAPPERPGWRLLCTARASWRRPPHGCGSQVGLRLWYSLAQPPSLRPPCWGPVRAASRTWAQGPGPRVQGRRGEQDGPQGPSQHSPPSCRRCLSTMHLTSTFSPGKWEQQPPWGLWGAGSGVGEGPGQHPAPVQPSVRPGPCQHPASPALALQPRLCPCGSLCQEDPYPEGQSPSRPGLACTPPLRAGFVPTTMPTLGQV